MAEIDFTATAGDAWDRLIDDPTRRTAARAATRAVERIAENPWSARVRAIRFTNGMWATPFRVGDNDWLVVWSDRPTGPCVEYVGPQP